MTDVGRACAVIVLLSPGEHAALAATRSVMAILLRSQNILTSKRLISMKPCGSRSQGGSRDCIMVTHKLRPRGASRIGGIAQFASVGCLRYDLRVLQQLPVMGRGNSRRACRDLELAEYRGDVVVNGAG